MHHCLRTPELLLNIFRHIYDEVDPNDYGIYKGTLAGLARTCRDFTEPALDTLWYSMDSFLPLIRCLPSRVLEINIVQSRKARLLEPYPKLNINSNLQEQDFSRMRYYASRIKIICLDGGRYGSSGQRDPFVDVAVYEHLASAKPFPGPLLPNVRHLAISLAYLNGDDPVPRLILGPHLQTLRISGACENASALESIDWSGLASLLISTGAQESVVDLGIALEDINTYFTPFHIDCPNSFLSPLTKSQHLSVLDLESFRILKTETVESLGLIPNLETLTMNVDLEKLDPFAKPLQCHDGYFTGLKRLKLIVTGAQVVSDLLSQWKASKLESLIIERFHRNFVWDLRELCKDFADHLPPDTLRSITLRNGIGPYFSMPYNYNTSDLSYADLRQLFRFHHLERLSVSLGARILCYDSQLPEFAEAWPNMRHLELYEREFSTTASVTPAGVYSLIEFMPCLRHLVLRFDASDPANFPDINAVRPHRLRYLDVCTSDADESAPLATFLENAFPMLEYLRWGWVYEHPQLPGSGWETRLDDEDEQIRNDDSHECWISTFEKLVHLNLPRLKRY